MKFYCKAKSKNDFDSMNNYVEKELDKVLTLLTNTKKDINSADQFATAFNILWAKNKLSALLYSITDVDED